MSRANKRVNLKHMTAEQIKSLYAEKMAALDKAQNEYDKVRRAIGELIKQKKNFHRREYVSSIFKIDDDGNIHYEVSSTDDDGVGSNKIHISEIATDQ
jgi:hypothetical protein